MYYMPGMVPKSLISYFILFIPQPSKIWRGSEHTDTPWPHTTLRASHKWRIQMQLIRFQNYDSKPFCSALFSLSCTGEGNGSPLQYFCLENPRDGGAWWAVVYRITQSRTQLKRLSTRSSSSKLLRSI